MTDPDLLVLPGPGLALQDEPAPADQPPSLPLLLEHFMQMTNLGVLSGLLLGIAILLDGFSGFAIVAVLGALGLVVGRVLDGQLDLGSLVPDNSKQRR